MAIVKRDKPDIFQEPVPQKGVASSVAGGVKTSVVDTVLGAVTAMGSGVVSVLSGLLAASLILYSGYVLYDSLYTMNQAQSDSSWNLLDYKPEIIEDGATPLAGWETLQEINDDYRAWLTIYDTSIDYPVLQGENDLYYASHNIYGESSLTGAIYLAAQNDPSLRDSYNLLYGHHMANGAMFGSLDSYREKEYFDSHREGVIVAKSGIFDIEIFAVAQADAYDSAVYNVGDRKEMVLEFLRNGGNGNSSLQADVLFFDEEAAEGTEKIIALSTCDSAETNGRLIVFGKMTVRSVLMLEADENQSYVYDGTGHPVQAITALTEGTTIYYSIDGGVTWTTEPPTLTDVGEYTVLIRAENETAGTAETQVTLRVTPRPVTVTPGNYFKVYGSMDPGMDAVVTGLVGDDTIRYQISRDPGENVGSYPVYATGDREQGNYLVTFEQGTLTITSAESLAVTAIGYVGTYDGQPHALDVSVNIEEGTTLEYSTDGGVTWTTEPPALTEPGELTVLVRATNPNYNTATTAAVIRITEADTPAERRTETVVIAWNDDNNADGTRPDRLYITLTGGGQTYLAEVSAANNWTATLEVPRYDEDGNPIRYEWTQPGVAGYTQEVVQTADGVTTIINTRNQEQPSAGQYTLRIRYRYANGTQAAEDYVTTLREGDPIDVTSPAISGYTASQTRVTGTMPGRNVEITVQYTANASPAQYVGGGFTGSTTTPSAVQVVEIEDYETALGLGSVFLNIGDCYE